MLFVFSFILFVVLQGSGGLPSSCAFCYVSLAVLVSSPFYNFPESEQILCPLVCFVGTLLLCRVESDSLLLDIFDQFPILIGHPKMTNYYIQMYRG